MDFIFIETAAHENLHVLQTGCIQLRAHVSSMHGKISGIEANAGDTEFRPQFACQANDVFNPSLSVICVDEKNRSGVGRNEMAERREFVIECKDVTVRHRARDRNVPRLSGYNTRG
jgi:hypothetical protein